MINQKEATYNAVVSAFKNNGVSFQEGNNAKELMTAEIRTEVRNTLFEQFRSGDINYSDEFASTKLNNDSELKKYVGGLLSNWLKKDKRLNGNVKYQIQNPGSRAGQGDKQVKAIRQLIKQLEVAGDSNAVSEAKEALAARKAEIAAEKAAKSNPVQVEALPEHLKHLVNS